MESVYHVRGVIRAVNLQGGTLDIHHEEIPGYMPAMVMPFNLRNPDEAALYEPGQAVAFDFVVTKDDSWIRNVRKLENPGLLALSPADSRSPSPPSTPRLKEGDAVPGFELVTQEGKPFTREMLAGRQTVLTFIFTRCPVPNFCPLLSRKFAELHAAIEQRPELGNVQLLSITIDPEFDTPAVLSRYAEQAGAKGGLWNFATGKPEEISRLAAAFSVHREPERGLLNHSLTTALVDGSGAIRRIWRGNFWEPAEVLEALRLGSTAT